MKTVVCKHLLALGFVGVASASILSPRNYDDDCVAPGPLAVITPCPTCELCTVTRQNQPVSTCIPQYAVKQANGEYNTIYSTHHYNWISTVVPCAVAPYYATVTDSSQYVTVASQPQYAIHTLECPTPGEYEINGTPTYVAQPTIIHYQSAPSSYYECLPFNSMPEFYHLIGKGVPSSYSQPIRGCHCPEDYSSDDNCDCNEFTRHISTQEEETPYVVPGYPVVIDHQFDHNGDQEFDVGGVYITININNAPTHYHHTTHVPPHTGTTTKTVTSTRTVTGSSGSTLPTDTGLSAPFVLGVNTAGGGILSGNSGRLRHKHRRGFNKRSVTGYIRHFGPNFVYTTDSSQAAVFRINTATGQLITDHDSFIAAARGDVNSGFGKLTEGLLPGENTFDTEFSVGGDGFLTWTNAAFKDGFADFCLSPLDNAIYELFGGIQTDALTCNIVQLVSQPVGSSISSTTSAATSSPTSSGTVGNPTTGNPSTVIPGSTISPTSSPTAQAGLAADVLAKHNALRALHSAPPVTYDDTAAAFARTIADKCVFAHSGGQYGENLAEGYATFDQAIDAWYAEGAQYNYNSPGFSSATGHFTQVVWVGSTGLGCAVKNCPGMGNLYVCEYNPAGNIEGGNYFQTNVLPPVAAA